MKRPHAFQAAAGWERSVADIVATPPVSTAIELDGGKGLDGVIQRLHESGVPDADIHIEYVSYPTREVRESDLSQSIRLGAMVGLPGVYVFLVCLALIAGTPLVYAAWIALIPAIFCGWFVAGFVFLNARVARVETHAHIIPEHERGSVSVNGPHAADAGLVFDEVRAAAK